MPKSLIFPARQTGDSPKTAATTNFTGNVNIDAIHKDDPVGMITVTFSPGARTHWHTHKQGQILKVVSGSGWICDAGGLPRRITAGDLVWAPPGTTHWHGASEGCEMAHLAIGLGQTVWGDPVTEEEYTQMETQGSS
ncbi:hypothetical protein FE257_005732 [Aspergillus nanangensis]|uniref:Cupin type-2 domain-containing protein n=1 Tax=Aspergillus nanangensis TaxID=2582783 RepID=A0AAD4CQ56_ASPNN|nr:hypothetical protein FE257_005732 [Aspergillus nanangensis]